jgi:hypothetical protein
MNNIVKRQLDAFDRVVEFGANYPLIPAIAAVTALYTAVGNAAIAIRGHKGDQESGRGEFHGGTSTRGLMAERLLGEMRPINKIARALDRNLFPGVREKFYMPRLGGFEGLIGRAEAFIDAVSPIKSIFTDRGLPATFDTDLEAAKDALVAATGNKYSGLATQVGGTAGVEAKARLGLKQMRELDAALSYQYRNDPVLLAAWKSACRVERDPVSESEPETPAPTAPPAA